MATHTTQPGAPEPTPTPDDLPYPGSTTHTCLRCGDYIPLARAALGYTTCLPCGETQARAVRHCAAPLSKGNYILITNPEVLRQLNPKRTT